MMTELRTAYMTIPTFELYKKCNPEGNEFDWIVNYSPYNPYSNVERYTIEDGRIDYDTRIKLVVLDDEFIEKYKWLKGRNADKYAMKYAQAISDEECLRLLKKHNKLNTYRINFLCIKLDLKNINTYPDKLSRKTRELIQEYFEGVWGEENVYVGNELMNSVDLFNNLGRCYREMISAINCGENINYNVKQRAKDDSPFIDLYLPILIKGRIGEPYIYTNPIIEELKNDYPDPYCFAGTISFETEYLQRFNFKTKIGFEESKAWKSLKGEFADEPELLDTHLIADYILPMYHMSCVKEWEEMQLEEAKSIKGDCHGNCNNY